MGEKAVPAYLCVQRIQALSQKEEKNVLERRNFLKLHNTQPGA